MNNSLRSYLFANVHLTSVKKLAARIVSLEFRIILYLLRVSFPKHVNSIYFSDSSYFSASIDTKQIKTLKSFKQPNLRSLLAYFMQFNVCVYNFWSYQLFIYLFPALTDHWCSKNFKNIFIVRS